MLDKNGEETGTWTWDGRTAVAALKLLGDHHCCRGKVAEQIVPEGGVHVIPGIRWQSILDRVQRASGVVRDGAPRLT